VGDGDAEFGEGAHDEIEVLRKGVFHADLAAGDRAEREEGDDLVVVGLDGEGAAVEALDALDHELAGADAGDFRAHAGEHRAEILHVRFAGGVDERGGAAREGGGHRKVFGDGDRHVVEPVACGLEAVGQADGERVALVYERAECAEDFEVRIDLAHAERAALGVGGDGNLAEAVQERGVEEHRGAHVLRELIVG